MKTKTLWLAASGIAWIAAFAAGGYALLTSTGPAHQIRPHELHREASRDEAGSIGHQRYEALREATRHYVEEHPEAAAALEKDGGYAPTEYLNEELARSHARFRVRRVEDGGIEFYSVS